MVWKLFYVAIDYRTYDSPSKQTTDATEEVRIGSNVKTSEKLGWGGPTSLIWLVDSS